MSILETIDGALVDYEASGDAMRWVPEEKREARPRTPLSGQISLNGSTWVPVSYDTTPIVNPRITFDMSGFSEALQRMADALQPAVEAAGKMCAQFTHSIDRGFFPEQHKRCTVCHPWRRPKPLAVNGHEYQRRLKARRRRRR